MVALLAVPMAGAIGLALEAGNWVMLQRYQQNVADSAALAAAATVSTNSGIVTDEAQAVAMGYGYESIGATRVNAEYKTSNCPTGWTSCYYVEVERDIPLSLTRIVGYGGTKDVTVDGRPAQTVHAESYARPRAAGANWCMVGLSTTGGNGASNSAVSLNGTPRANLSGCDLWSNSTMHCGGNAVADYSTAVTTDPSCSTNAPTTITTSQIMTDPYAGFQSTVPTMTCTKAQTNPTINQAYVDNTANITTQSVTFKGSTANVRFIRACGTATVSGTVQIKDANTALVVQNGTLYLGKAKSSPGTLETTGSGSLTVIFNGSGSTPSSGSYYPTGDGTMSFVAPNTGPYSGVAIAQTNVGSTASTKNSSLNWTEMGNTPTLSMAGLVYMPQGQVTVAGSVNLKTYSCIGFIADRISVSGTGAILSNNGTEITSGCTDAGLVMPQTPGQREGLIQ